MNLPRLSVARPVFTSMAALAVIVLGLVSLRQLRIDLLPDIERPTLSVRTGYEGADPEVVERQVTQIVEEIIGTVPGVIDMTSTSSEGRSNVSVTFAWGTDIDVAAQDVRARLEQELSELPDEVDRPQLRKFDIASFPVVLLGISGRLDPIELNDLAERQIRYRFARLPGVAQVDLWGGYDRELRVGLDPDRLRALGLSADRVVRHLRDQNIDLPAGAFTEGQLEITLRAPAEFASVDELRASLIPLGDGAVVPLAEIARVEDTYQRLSRIIRVNGERGIRVAIRKEADANTVEVARAIHAEIERVNRDMPQVQVVAVIDQGNFIERSIANVIRSVLYGGGLALLILLFFLRHLRSTLVVGVAIPLSIMATLTLVYFGGLTLNLMTLGGLALGVGMMVDNAIVVLENIFRRRQEEGEDAATAAVKGSGEVASAIVASTITTLVIFLPVLFVEGAAALLFRELALVVMLALLASLAVSLSLVPMLAAKLLRSPAEAEAGASAWARLCRWADRQFHELDNAYHDFLVGALRRPWRILGGAVIMLVASSFLWPRIGSEFLPPSDEGEVRVSAEMPAGTRLDLADEQARRLEALVLPLVPELESWVSSVSASGRRGDAATEVDLRMSLVPATARQRSNSAIADDLRKKLNGQVAGMTIRTRAPQGQLLLDRLLDNGEGLRIELRGFELEVLEARAAEVMRAIEDVPGITDLERDSADRVPQERLHIDRARVADLGLEVADVARILESAVAGRTAGEYRPEGWSYRIFVQIADAEDRPLDELLAQPLLLPDGRQVPLATVVTTAPSTGPAEIRREDQQRTVAIDANVAGRDLGSVAEDVRQRIASIPPRIGYETRLGGAYEAQQEAAGDLLIAFVLALLLVYMVLASQYESLRDPLVVMLSVPMAAIGVAVTLFITRSTLNLQSGIGCIMLGGIVVNNAILLVDQAGRLRREGLATTAAIAEAGRRRLRPILMTTLTTILGLLPLALGIGEGADAQAPLARAVVGGLLASTLITLVLVPVGYLLVHGRGAGEMRA